MIDRTNDKNEKQGRSSGRGRKVLLDGLLILAVVAAAIIAYHRLHPQKKFEAPRPAPHTAIHKDGVSELPAVQSPEATQAPTGTEEHFKFLEMEFGSGQGGSRFQSDPSDREQAATGTTEGGVPKANQNSPAETRRETPEYSDAEPPSLISIRFEPQKASPGTDVSIHVSARDNLSGVDSVAGTLKSPSGGAVLPFGCQPSETDESFVAVFRVPDQAEAGAWAVDSLRLTDNVHNTSRLTDKDGALAGATFQVVGSDSDSVPPHILAIHIEPSEAYGGEQVRIDVHVKDDKSGVARVYGAFMSPSGNARLSFLCSEKAEPDMVYGETTLPKDAESGDWVLGYLRAEDEAKNAKTFSATEDPAIFDNAVIRVFAAGSDAQPPTINDISVSTPVVAYGEKVDILVSASDDLSGISGVSGRLQSPSGKAVIPFFCVYDPNNDVYRAEITIKTNTEVGIWRVEYIQMADEARNQATYSYQTNSFVQGAVFEVTGE
jgi:hypothetical protein